MHVQKSVDIAAPSEEVWRFLADPERVLEWYVPFETFEYTGDQQGGLGAPLFFEERMGIQSVGLNCVVTDWVEQETFAFEMSEGPSLISHYAERWSLEGTPDGCRFTLTLDYEFPWKMANTLLGPFVQRNSAATVEGILERLKGLAEG